MECSRVGDTKVFTAALKINIQSTALEHQSTCAFDAERVRLLSRNDEYDNRWITEDIIA